MDLILAAPGIVRGARKLWTDIRSARPKAPAGSVMEQLELQIGELRKELAASSEVIKAMAEQNERLVEAVGILRARVRLLTVICVIFLVLGVAVAVKLLA